MIKFDPISSDIPINAQESKLDTFITDAIPHDLDYIKGFMMILIEKLKELKSTNFILTHPSWAQTNKQELFELKQSKSVEAFVMSKVVSFSGQVLLFKDILARFMPGFLFDNL
ncbi:hypothetical protein RF11_03869 [Thelohanellus kitauei]|uniref:Uncharacterized protein n=1 Tax=Thelohanellus kitauei TaxID=669202 RepID=A0A0C2J5K7_THEKT|nr:hypothetical protein RF11_03869 [Thelohanellus kitauei]